MTDMVFVSTADANAVALAQLGAEQSKLAAQRPNPNIAATLNGFKGSFGLFNASSQMMIGGLAMTEKLNEEQTAMLRKVSACLGITYAAFMLYSSIAKLRSTKAALLTVLAAGESAAYAATIVNAWRIPLAVGAAIGVAAMFGSGYMVGSMSRHTDANVSGSGDISRPEDRRLMLNQIRGYN